MSEWPRFSHASPGLLCTLQFWSAKREFEFFFQKKKQRTHNGICSGGRDRKNLGKKTEPGTTELRTWGVESSTSKKQQFLQLDFLALGKKLEVSRTEWFFFWNLRHPLQSSGNCSFAEAAQLALRRKLQKGFDRTMVALKKWEPVQAENGQ